MTKSNPILSKGQTIDNEYTINFFLKKGSYAETYRVQNEAKETKKKLILYLEIKAKMEGNLNEKNNPKSGFN